MDILVIDKQTEEIMERHQNVEKFEGNTVVIKAGAGYSSINYGDNVYLREATDEDVQEQE